MSFGGSSTPLPKAQPIEPVPQEEGSNQLEAKRKARMMARDRDGYTGHTHSRSSTTMSEPTNQGARGETIQGQAKAFDTTPNPTAPRGRHKARMLY